MPCALAHSRTGGVHPAARRLASAPNRAAGYPCQPSRPIPGCTFPRDGRPGTTESTSLAAMTRPARTRDGHEPASGWRLSCTGVASAASPLTKSAAGRATRGEGSYELSATAWLRGRYRSREPAGMVPGPDRAAITALVGRRAMGPAYATPARINMGASVSVPGRYCVRFRRGRRGPPAGRRPSPAAGRPARWHGICARPDASVIASGQDAGAAGSRPASRPAGIAGPAGPRAGTAVSSAPRITAAEAP